MKHLVLIQYKFNPDSNEIITAVNTFKHYAQFEYDMYFLGDSCPYLPEVPTIEGDHTDLSKYPCRAQHIHVARDLRKAYELFHKQYDEFCLMSDDFFSINPFTWEDLCIPKYNTPTIRTNRNTWDPRFWANAKWKTGQLFAKHGIVGKDFTTHTFAVYNFEKLMYIIERYNLTEPNNDYTFEDLYGNEFWKDAEDVSKWRLRLQSYPKFTICFKQAKEQGMKWANFSEFKGVNSLLKYLDVQPTEYEQAVTCSQFKLYQGEKGIISLTSWKARINTVHLTLENLIEQCPGFHIVLVLAEEEFPDRELPESITVLKDHIEVMWVKKNYKVYKKVAFTLRKYPDVPVISADDDCLYECNYAEELYQEWLKTKEHIIRYTYNSRMTCVGSCTLHWKMEYPVETIPSVVIEQGKSSWPGFDDDFYAEVYKGMGYTKIHSLNKKRLPLTFHDVVEPLTSTELQKKWYKTNFVE